MKKQHQDTYRRAMSMLMSRLLFTYVRKELDFSDRKEGYWKMAIMQSVPEGALVVPFAITDAKEWWLGWYLGKNEDGCDLVESIETHRICEFSNTGFLFLDNLDFANNPLYRYSDREFDIIDTIKRRVSRNNDWFVVGYPVFHEDGSIDVPIRKKFTQDFYVKTYKNLRSCTIAALDQHCSECNAIANEKEGGEK